MTPTFEIKSIRSWTRSRLTGRTQADSSRRNGPASGADAELASVLEAYDERFESAAAAKRTDAERHEEFEREADRLLETVIAPALESVGRQLADHGHDWDVESRVDILGQPAIACAFWPRETPRAGQIPSELSFRFLYPDRLTVTGAAMGGRELDELPPRSHQIEVLDEALVVKEATRFVSVILSRS